jgi:hypothetical protein
MRVLLAFNKAPSGSGEAYNALRLAMTVRRDQVEGGSEAWGRKRS